jgi:hypothetical protein
MKGALIALILVIALTIPVAASAQDWVMDWTSAGQSIGAISSSPWSISGSSPTTLTPLPFGMPSDFSKPAYEMSFTWEGRTYGGPVSEQSNFQSPVWRAPVPCSGIFASNCTISGSVGGAFGSFAFTDSSHFALDVLVGTPHSYTELRGTGTLVGGGGGGGVATAAEPTVLLLSGVGLVGAAVLRRSRRS